MKERNGLYFFDIFQPFPKDLFHVTTSKKYHSLRNEDEKNRESLASTCKISKQWVYLKQVHGDEILIVNDEFDFNASPNVADAAITNLPGFNLVINTADCQAILLFDPIKKVVAAVHSGWRGAAKMVTSKVILLMSKIYGCEPNNILAGVSPSLGPCCSYFTDPHNELPKHMHKYILTDGHKVDFYKAINDELLAAGLKKDHIELAKICTKCKSDLFFSYRQDKQDTGRMASIIGLK